MQTLQQIRGVGAVTSLGFILTLGNSERLVRSRDAGAYLDLQPRRYQSGESNPQLEISKEGDGFMRRNLATAAQYILGLDQIKKLGDDFSYSCALARSGRGLGTGFSIMVKKELFDWDQINGSGLRCTRRHAT